GTSIRAIAQAGTVTCETDDDTLLTVAESDLTPTVSSVSKINFDQSDGFTVTDDTGGVVTVGFSGGGGGGTGVALDLGDMGSNDSSAITEIATIRDDYSVFTEPSADK